MIDIWSILPNRRDGKSRARLLRLLVELDDASLASRFLREIVLVRYNGDENDDLPTALGAIGTTAAGEFLTELVESRFASRPEAVLSLLRRVGESADFEWRDSLGGSVRAALAALPKSLGPREDAREPTGDSGRKPSGKRLGEQAVHDLFAVAWHCGLTEEAEAAESIIADHPKAVEPERVIPTALSTLYPEERLAESAAYQRLWRHAADSLLNRSACPPDEPRDWKIAADISCDCDHCDELRNFCSDPDAKVRRFPLRKELRRHLHRQIDGNRLDMSHVTERRGSPYTLVCTKNRASYRRRLAEYGRDVECMRSLTRLAPKGEGADAADTTLQRLCAAIAAAE